jgi:hypothetical protein
VLLAFRRFFGFSRLTVRLAEPQSGGGREEQDAAIGKLSRERTEVKREPALLLRQIKDTARAMSGFTHILIGSPSPDYAAGLKEVDKLVSIGGMDSLKEAIAEYLVLEARISRNLRKLA